MAKMKYIKQEINYNKYFVHIPTQRLAELITYKAKLQGIEIKLQEEIYTSGCSVIDLDYNNKEV